MAVTRTFSGRHGASCLKKERSKAGSPQRLFLVKHLSEHRFCQSSLLSRSHKISRRMLPSRQMKCTVLSSKLGTVPRICLSTPRYPLRATRQHLFARGMSLVSGESLTQTVWTPLLVYGASTSRVPGPVGWTFVDSQRFASTKRLKEAHDTCFCAHRHQQCRLQKSKARLTRVTLLDERFAQRPCYTGIGLEV